MTQLLKKCFSKSRIETNKTNVNVVFTEWPLKTIFLMQNLHFFFFAFSSNKYLVQTSKKQVKKVRSTMKMSFLNGLCHISNNGPTSYSKEAKGVVKRAVEKYNLYHWHYKRNRPHAVIPKNSSVSIEVDLAQNKLLNQMKSRGECSFMKMIMWCKHISIMNAVVIKVNQIYGWYF